MPLPSFLISQTPSAEENLLDLIEKEIEKVKKHGKYIIEENLTLTHTNLTEGKGSWQNIDPRYPAKLNVLNALNEYMCSSRNTEDWAKVDAVIHDSENKDFDKGGVFGHSTTLQLVWKVRDIFPPVTTISSTKTQRQG